LSYSFRHYRRECLVALTEFLDIATLCKETSTGQKRENVMLLFNVLWQWRSQDLNVGEHIEVRCGEGCPFLTGEGAVPPL